MIAGDFRLLVYVALIQAALLIAAAVVLRAFGLDVRKVLTSREWRVLLKLGATLLMFYILLIRTIYAGLPAEQFIYGRF